MLLLTVPEFERDIIRERTPAGLASARARGRLGGRPRALDEKKVILAKAMYDSKDASVKDICHFLDIGKTTFYRYVNAHDDDKK